MKKLMVLATVAAMAMGAKADWTLDWSGDPDDGKFYFGSTNAGFNDEVTGWKDYSQIYIITKEDYVSWTAGGALQSKLAGFSLATDMEGWALFEDSGEHTLVFSPQGDFPKTVPGSIEVEYEYGKLSFDEQPLYAVITDGKTGYFVEGVYSVNGAGDINFDNSFSVGTPFKNDDLRSFSGATPTPEPTSGLLLLLGVAGLALKRKIK